MKFSRQILILLVSLIVAVPCAWSGGRFNDNVLNRPYADMRRFHLGFSIGIHSQDLLMTHSGYVTESGQEWRIEQPNYQPGFCVNGLVAMRLNNYFSLRFSPGMYFGSRDLRMIDINSGTTERENVKATFVVLPIDLKFAGARYRNCRPYIVGGIMPVFDVGKKRNDDIFQLNTSDMYLSVGFGCDFYLPYFKLIPELKFCFGLTDVLKHDRPDLVDDPEKYNFTQTLTKATSNMIVLTFYFE